MLRTSRRLLFAIEAVADIAYNGGPLPVQSREITLRHGIPRRYLEPVLQQLVRTGILIGVRGPRGGYRLARNRRDITVGEITRAIQAMDDANDPVQDAAGSELGLMVVRPLWREIQREMLGRLERISVDELCMRARIAGIGQRNAKKPEFGT